jgi:hypothetical protein
MKNVVIITPVFLYYFSPQLILQCLPSLFNNFGLAEKLHYFHGAQISVTVNTHMPRNNKKQKQNFNI